MKIIFGTTNKRKVEDLQNVANLMELDLQILSLDDIGYDEGEIEENGTITAENSMLKAVAIYEFCNKNKINFPIIADDAGLFCEALGGEPGVFTARYADAERLQNPTLPKYECVNKLLRNLSDKQNRNAKYECVVTCILSGGEAVQTMAETKGQIANEILGELKKPYFYSVFVPDGFDKPFSELSSDELLNTYRYVALKEMLAKISKNEKDKEKTF